MLATGGGGGTGGNETNLVSAITQSSVGVATPVAGSHGRDPPRGESTLVTRTRVTKTTASASRKYRSWCFEVDEGADICLGMLGQGSTFCTVKNCRKTHWSNTYHLALPGELYVAKTADTAFVDPCVKTSSLRDDLVEKWKLMNCTLDEWTSLFNLVDQNVKDEDMSSLGINVKFSGADLQVKNQEEHTALAFKTPRKQKQMDLIKESLEIQPFNNVIGEVEQVINVETNRSHITELDDRTVEIRSTLEKFLSQFEEERALSLSYFESNDVRITKMKTCIGSKPNGLDERFEAPNLWLTIGSVAEEVSRVSDSYVVEITNVKDDLSQILAKTDEKVQQELLPLQQKLKELESFAVDSARMLQANMVTLASRNSHATIPQPQDYSKILQRLEALETELRIVKSANDNSAIKYSGLGFRSQKECDAWIEANQPSSDYGLLLDFNGIMEHVWMQSGGQKILSSLERASKIKLHTNNQAVTLTSFETRIPKFFSGDSKTMGVVKEGDSYFKLIKTWEEWNTPHDGFRDQLKRELSVFELGHSETISSELEQLTVFHSLVSKALADSITWANKLIKFIDDTFREYSRARYGAKKAWHVTTKLAIALMEYISAPRTVVFNSFRVGNHLSVAKSVSYSFLKCLDLMVEIEKLDFRNSPIITSELAKFLALNSNYESVEQLQKEIVKLNEGMSKSLKDAASAVKSVGTIGNNFDKSQKEIGALSKRVKTLESK